MRGLSHEPTNDVHGHGVFAPVRPAGLFHTKNQMSRIKGFFTCCKSARNAPQAWVAIAMFGEHVIGVIMLSFEEATPQGATDTNGPFLNARVCKWKAEVPKRVPFSTLAALSNIKIPGQVAGV